MLAKHVSGGEPHIREKVSTAKAGPIHVEIPVRTALSVVIPTHNRPQGLLNLLAELSAQEAGERQVEILVVDDGSEPPVTVDASLDVRVRVLRRDHAERSTARNHGASQATGSILLFLDDDLEIASDLLAAHLAAHREWAGCLAVGAIRLSQEVLQTPFGRFREALERSEVPSYRGLVQQRNFCTAQNMSILRSRFEVLGGFDPTIVSAEDQDLALRHSEDGGRIAYLPEAAAIHHDANADIRSYCRRVEWGAEHMVPFIQKHPALPANLDRTLVNGPTRWSDPTSVILKKLGKSALDHAPAERCLMGLAALIERRRPASSLLPRLYRLLIGIHLQRGLRRGWRTATPSGARS